MLLAYAITGLIILLIMLMRPTPSSLEKVRFLNTLLAGQALLFSALTVYVLWFIKLPVYFFPGEYLFIDEFGIYEVLVSSVIFLLSAIYARGYINGLMRLGEIRTKELKIFYGSFSFLMTVIVFALFSNNLALYWILLELTTLLSALLVVTLHVKENIGAALKYIFTASSAMLFSFIGLIVLFEMTRQSSGSGTLNWDLLMNQASDLPPELFILAFTLIFIGFAAKAGIVPFHTWLPQAHAKAPSVVSVLLSAVLLNVGIYGILRLYSVAHRTSAFPNISILLIVFGLLSVAIAAFSMLPRTNVKKLIAFSSIEHMGLILIGIGLGTPLVLFWVLFYTLAHSLVKTLLFFSAGVMHQQYGNDKFENMNNVMVLQPLASWGMIIGSVAITGTPLFPVFLPKLFILSQLGNFSLPALFAVLVLLLIVAAAFASILIKNFPRKNQIQICEPYIVPWAMKAPMCLLFVAILFLGLYIPESLRQLLNGVVVSLGF